MSRDLTSQFSLTPNVVGRIPRSRFIMNNDVKLSMNTGQLIPFDCKEILPGDNISRETNALVRLQTLLTPMFDDLKLDIWYFFVPNRLVWDHWQEFCGENSKSAWVPETSYTIPQVTIECTDSIYDYSVADYMGVPKAPSNGTLNVNALPFRAYGLIYNEWFRDENLQDPILVHTDDSTQIYTSNIDYKGKPFNVGKYHDYFTSCLPSPQKGPDVPLPMGGQAPVIPGTNFTNDFLNSLSTKYVNTFDFTTNKINKLGISGSSDRYEPGTSSSTSDTVFSNLYADLQNAVSPSINALRLAFATQHLYEIDSQGTRYTSILRNHFGVISPDARLQRPELLSYNSFNLNIAQVVQTSESAATPQGTTSGISVTGNSDNSFTKSFVEHGYLIGLCSVRYKNSYQQGLHRMWSRRGRFDFYWPVFANLGNQPVLNKEIYAQGNTVDDEVFGYQEAYAEYRYSPDRVCAEMRSSFAQSLDAWHLADDYASLPKLSPTWIQADKSNVDRALAVQSNTANQIFMDIAISDDIVRPMPTYSVPGLKRM